MAREFFGTARQSTLNAKAPHGEEIPGMLWGSALAAPSGVPTKSLGAVKFPASVTEGARKIVAALKLNGETSSGHLNGAFLRKDPNVNPILWEMESGNCLRELMGPSLTELYSAFSSTKNFLHIRGLPAEDSPPLAPYHGHSTYLEVPITLMNMFGIVSLMNGCAFAYTSENDGLIVRDVVARSAARDELSSQGWRYELPWHMDGAFRPLTEKDLFPVSDLSQAPRWLVFGIIYGSREVPLTFVSVEDVLERLSQSDIAALCQPEFDVHSSASFSPSRVTRGISILIPDENGGYYSRFNQIRCCGTTVAARKALAAFSEVLLDPEIRYRIDIEAGDVVVLDNWRSLHMRLAYLPQWNGMDRWLLRIYAAQSQPLDIPFRNDSGRVWK